MGWDGILFLYEDNSVTERSVDAWKEHGLRYNSSPWHALKTVVRLLTTHVLPTRWDPGNDPSNSELRSCEDCLFKESMSMHVFFLQYVRGVFALVLILIYKRYSELE